MPDVSYPMIGGGRALKTCAGCMQTDDHPKCRVQDETTGEWKEWHTDCHFIVFGEMDCHEHLHDGSYEGKRGADMLQHKLEFHAAKAGDGSAS